MVAPYSPQEKSKPDKTKIADVGSVHIKKRIPLYVCIIYVPNEIQVVFCF